MADRDNIIRMAREAGMDAMVGTTRAGKYEPKVAALKRSVPVEWLERFAESVIADFLQRSGQYLTNDASREAVIADAVAEERERIAREFDRREARAPGIGFYDPEEPAQIIRALGQHGATPATDIPLRSPDCWCETCDLAANAGFRSRMSLCPTCGNKRCPRATHHDHACTGSTAPGQKGSSWENVKPAAGARGQHD